MLKLQVVKDMCMVEGCVDLTDPTPEKNNMSL